MDLAEYEMKMAKIEQQKVLLDGVDVCLDEADTLLLSYEFENGRRERRHAQNINIMLISLMTINLLVTLNMIVGVPTIVFSPLIMFLVFLMYRGTYLLLKYTYEDWGDFLLYSDGAARQLDKSQALLDEATRLNKECE